MNTTSLLLYFINSKGLVREYWLEKYLIIIIILNLFTKSRIR